MSSCQTETPGEYRLEPQSFMIQQVACPPQAKPPTRVHITRMQLFWKTRSWDLFSRLLISRKSEHGHMATSAPPDVPPRVRQLASELADARPMRRGSLSERTIKCSKPGCAGAQNPQARHGPYHSLLHAVGSQPPACRGRPDTIPLPRRRAGRSGPAANRCWPPVSQPWGGALGGMRTMGRPSMGGMSQPPPERLKKGLKRISMTKSSRKSKPS
jgi:hypothetical protein